MKENNKHFMTLQQENQTKIMKLGDGGNAVHVRYFRQSSTLALIKIYKKDLYSFSEVGVTTL